MFTPSLALHPTLVRLQSQAERHDIQHQGRVICWRRWGSGPPMVLLHGGHGSWMHWVRNIEALARQRSVWIPDMPGFGDSENLPGDPHQPGRERLMVEALRSTLCELLPSGSDVDVVGFSFGGYVAAELAATAPQVRRLSLLGTAGHGGARRLKADLVNWRLDDPDQMRRALAHNLTTLMLHDPCAIDDLALSAHGISCLHTRFRSKDISRSAGLAQALDRFKGSVLLMWGEHDVTAVPEQIGPQLSSQHAQRRWVVVPGAGHWVQFESAQEVNQLLLNEQTEVTKSRHAR